MKNKARPLSVERLGNKRQICKCGSCIYYTEQYKDLTIYYCEKCHAEVHRINHLNDDGN